MQVSVLYRVFCNHKPYPWDSHMNNTQGLLLYVEGISGQGNNEIKDQYISAMMLRPRIFYQIHVVSPSFFVFNSQSHATRMQISPTRKAV